MDLERSPLATEPKAATQLNAARVNENQNESPADERITRRLTRFLTERRDVIAADLIAGVTVSMVAIPQSLAYAQLAGVAPIHGLYAAFLPTIVGALFGSSKLLSTGPVAMTSLLTAASLAPLAAQGSDLFNAYVILLAFLSGLFQLAFGILRMGVLLNFLSHPVLMGFINAAAIVIALSQVPTMLGLAAPNTGHFLLDILHVLGNVGSTHVMSLCFGAASIGALMLFKQKKPNFPGVLVTVASTTIISYAIGFEHSGGHVVGVVPQGFPALTLPPLDWQGSVALLPASFVIALVSFMEAMSSAKVIAIRTREPWNENRELIGQGLAKIVAACCNSMPVSGSFSRSALNLASNAKTALSSIISALFVVLTLLALTPLLYHLPKAVLAAIIMMAVTNLVNVTSLRNAWRANIDDGCAGLITFGATLVFAPNIQFGILTGILLSLSLLLYRIMRPRVVLLGLTHGSLRDAHRHNIAPLGGRLGALRFDGALQFVNVAYFEDALLELESANPDLTHILIKCNGINRLDASGVEMLFNLVRRFRRNGITLVFSGPKHQVYQVMERTGLVKEIGGEHIFPSDRDALKALGL
jgi:SulP family sulfate permease